MLSKARVKGSTTSSVREEAWRWTFELLGYPKVQRKIISEQKESVVSSRWSIFNTFCVQRQVH